MQISSAGFVSPCFACTDMSFSRGINMRGFGCPLWQYRINDGSAVNSCCGKEYILPLFELISYSAFGRRHFNLGID